MPFFCFFSDWSDKEMNNSKDIRDDSCDPDQPTEGEEGDAQVKSLPHGQNNLRMYLFVREEVKDEDEPVLLGCEPAARPRPGPCESGYWKFVK